MATKPAAKKPPVTPSAGAPAAPKAARKPKIAALTTAQKFELLSMVKAASVTLPDATLADQLTAHFGRPVLTNAVTKYRKEFGIASVGKPKTEDLLNRIAELEAQIAVFMRESVTPEDGPPARLTD